jgi:hypothetical protein
MKKITLILILIGFTIPAIGQNASKSGAWYMYFGNLRFKDSPWAIHGEAQHRNFNKIGDLDQLLLRTGLQYNSRSGQSSFLAGYASITNGKEGDSKAIFHENRLYQEIILRQKMGNLALQHRYRYEQRWIENQNFRTRFRYALSLNIPLSTKSLTEKGASYLQVYDELFINGEKLGGKIQFFDRNRFYVGFGYRIYNGLAVQLGFMEQTTASVSRGQFQIGIHQQLFSQ